MFIDTEYILRENGDVDYKKARLFLISGLQLKDRYYKSGYDHAVRNGKDEIIKFFRWLVATSNDDIVSKSKLMAIFHPADRDGWLIHCVNDEFSEIDPFSPMEMENWD